ncbi:MAG TPA: hypothetical protein DDZ80_20790 [Cyanobacteria bacterium UBA8803]|nr:hypothetical protein [Cyanobacteria bacterium UBA9273]HBL60783.1 hypothetical protein [Cyanobacteria bacterium UBA8803]
MNPQDNRDYERSFQQVEMNLDSRPTQPSLDTQPGQTLYNGFPNSQPMKLLFHQIANWFNTLPTIGKVVVAIAAASIGFSLLRTVLQLVASLISLAILGGMLYFAYKFFISSQSVK